MLAVSSPSFPHRAAAMFLRHPTSSGISATSSRVIVVTRFLPYVDAPHRVRFVAQLESNWTVANHSTVRVEAATIFTNPWCLHAFVNVYKHEFILESCSVQFSNLFFIRFFTHRRISSFRDPTRNQVDRCICKIPLNFDIFLEVDRAQVSNTIDNYRSIIFSVSNN